ncbi:MAG: hypothetical protein C0615_08095 [Desulfuromonas sp.]|nr:MAG: hypothetical protein C0615_08095 [Desulfuromonas sp.]
MKYLQLKTIVLISFFLLISMTANAAVRPGAITLTPSVSAHFYDSAEGVDDTAEFGLSLGYNLGEHWGVELTATYAEPDLEVSPAPDLSIYTARLDGLYHFNPSENLVPYFVFGAGGIIVDVDGQDEDEDLLANYGFGFKYFVSDKTALIADVRHFVRFAAHKEGSSIKSDDEFNNVVTSLGVTFQFGGSELDSPRTVDTDRDGVIDSLDRCPGTAFRAEVDADGCPVDADGDGVRDVEDDCPNTEYGAVVNSVGCSPDQANVRLREDLKQPRNDVTVTAGMDSDGDSVLDADDHCPNTPYGVKVSPEGCGPDDVSIEMRHGEAGQAVMIGMERPAQLEKSAVADLESAGLMIEFAANGSSIHPRYFDDLRSIAAYLGSHPDARLMVEGHTDSTGSAQGNQKLSQHRADTVRWILVRDFGADAKRIIAKGFGETQPIADNDTQTGRAINRRVILKLMSR